MNNHLFHDIGVNISNIPANLNCKSSTKIFLNNINLLDYTKVDDPIPLMRDLLSITIVTLLVIRKWLKLDILFNVLSPIPVVIKGENIILYCKYACQVLIIISIVEIIQFQVVKIWLRSQLLYESRCKYTSCTIKSVNKIHMRVLLENQCHPTLLMNGWKAEKRKLMLVKFDILL